MKKIFLLLAAFSALQSFAQWPWKKIEGDGRLQKETRQVGAYTAVASSGAWNVIIGYGASNSVQVEGDANLLAYIETRVEDGRLSIRSQKNVNLRSKNKITVYVSLTKITGLSLSGSGDMIGQGRFSNEGVTDFKLSGSGTIKLSFDKVTTAAINISGSGNIHLSGAANAIMVNISGSGNADCGNLIAEDASAHISGSGNVTLHANRSIDASISGSGNVFYKGSASDVKKHIAGSGRLIRE